MDPLLEELYERPDDPAPYLVYADALQSRGDPRGELIALQAAGHDAAAFLTAHLDLAPPPPTPWPFQTDAAPVRPTNVEWLCGFWKSLDAFLFDQLDVDVLIAHPSAQVLRALSISGTGNVTFMRTCNQVATHLARTLESISLSFSTSDVRDADYVALAPCTRLREIHMSGSTMYRRRSQVFARSARSRTSNR